MAQTAGGVLKRGPDRIIAGVASGLGHYFRLDPVLVRVGFVVLALVHGIGILLYLVLWLVMEPATSAGETSPSLGDRVRDMGQDIRDVANVSPAAEHAKPRAMWLGLGLIAIGAYFMLDNLGLFASLDIGRFWPVLLIALGLIFLLRRP